MPTLPSFGDLPVTPGAPSCTSWGVWGPDDKLGCWNKIDEDATRRGVASVRRGRVFSVNAEHDPALTRHMTREPFAHSVRSIMGVAWDDVIDGFNTQGSTQWDGFGHFGNASHGHYGGLARDEHGVDAWAKVGFATRGVVVDVAAWRESAGRPIDVAGGEMVPIDEVLETLDHQGSPIEPGDILLLRFGWLRWWRGEGARSTAGLVLPGIEPSLRVAEVLWNMHIAAVAADPGIDPVPGKWANFTSMPSREEMARPEAALGLSLHNLIPLLGLSIGEFFDLDRLADDCAAAGDWSCLLTTAPMQLPGGVATPANALAIR
ncbi:MAG TPA: cyclase family protein [Acidimicrobiales bacterium]|nr:cyclase family protein [Acidimicrobiales bacterium]